ncbi:hypothetical protein [Reyranella sp.]|uniref:hypothetical protein n=1 Tax=Reyranella sp. TaxID=1929291 RepID=UPI003BACDC37
MDPLLKGLVRGVVLLVAALALTYALATLLQNGRVRVFDAGYAPDREANVDRYGYPTK